MAAILISPAMRAIGQLETESQARIFADFLYVRGIENHVEHQQGEGWAVWIRDEDKLAPATELLAEFKKDPTNTRFLEEARSASRLRALEDKTQDAYRKKVKDRHHIFKPLQAYGFGPLTFFLIAASSFVFILTRFATEFAPIHGLFISEFGWNRHWASMLPEVRHGQIWRLLTPAIIHMSLPHILFNMVCLRDLGSMIEARQGVLRLGLLVVTIAVGSNVAQYYMSGPAFGGMSGVIYGLLGYVWIRGKLDPTSGVFLHPSTVIMMLAWLVLGYTQLLAPMIGHMANTVHTVGLMIGMLWGFLSGLAKR